MINGNVNHPYRVFISYSHNDRELAQKLRDHLQKIGARPMSDLNIPEGARFNEDIRRQISFAHIFISLLTGNSKNRPWVHQELGYAMGLRIPILPLALDELPGGMAHEIQAIKVDPELKDLAPRVTAPILNNVVDSAQRAATALFECAAMMYQRTKTLVDNADEIHRLYGPARIRQRMAFSSFSIPNRHIKHPDWDERDGFEKRSPEIRGLLLEERRIMEKHSREAGCDLILDPYVQSSSTMKATGMGREAEFAHSMSPTLKRLDILVDFLESMPDDRVRVVFQRGNIDGGIHIIGDWFTAEAVVPHYKGGYQQTIFTRHAPTVLAKIQAFDQEFEEMLQDANPDGSSSRQVAIKKLKEIIDGLA